MYRNGTIVRGPIRFPLAFPFILHIPTLFSSLLIYPIIPLPYPSRFHPSNRYSALSFFLSTPPSPFSFCTLFFLPNLSFSPLFSYSFLSSSSFHSPPRLFFLFIFFSQESSHSFFPPLLLLFYLLTPSPLLFPLPFLSITNTLLSYTLTLVSNSIRHLASVSNNLGITISSLGHTASHLSSHASHSVWR